MICFIIVKKDVMIKKILLWLWISVVSLIGFSSAWRLQTIWLQDAQSIYDNNYMLTFLKGGGVLSNYLWTSKSVLALNSNTLFWWMWDWYPYFYDNHWQGYFSQYCSCDPLISDTTVPTNCSCLDIDSSSPELFKNFFKQVNAWDYAYYHYQPYYSAWQGCSNSYWWVSVCFSSSSIWRSLCFKQARCSWGCQWNWCSSICSQFWWCGGGLENSQNYTSLTFWNIPYSDIWYAPWQAWYDWWWNIEWSSSIWNNTSLTWNVMYSTCTNWYVVSQITNLYWWINNICYAWTNNTWIINDWVARTPIDQWLNFKEVYNWSLNITINGATPYYSSYLDWFNTWINNITRYKLWQISFDVFRWQPTYLYAYFDRLYNNWVIAWNTDAYNIANICKLALFSDLSQQYNWTQFSNVCSDLNYNAWNGWTVTTWEVWSIEDDSQEIIPWWTYIWWWWQGAWWWNNSTFSWNIVSVDWSWTLSWNTNQNFDWTTFINNFYQKLQANFQKPYNWLVWIVPTYILVFMIALILFRFLSH